MMKVRKCLERNEMVRDIEITLESLTYIEKILQAKEAIKEWEEAIKTHETRLCEVLGVNLEQIQLIIRGDE